MFLTTQDQERILTVLEQTRYLRTDQAARLLHDAKGAYATRVLRQLRYMQRVYFKTETVITLPYLSDRPLDTDMLSAVDIMLDIAGGSLLTLAPGRPPNKLCFLTEKENGIGSYAVVIVHEGTEETVSFQANTADSEKRTPILLLENMNQRETLTIHSPHFFALFDGEYRYFEGE